MSTKNLLSTAEIAALKLPGLPTSKGRIIDRAANEGWNLEERKGKGGTRKVYAVPERYLSSTKEHTDQQASVMATINQDNAKIDLQTLPMVETILDEVLQARELSIKSEQRGAIVAFLYDYAVRSV